MPPPVVYIAAALLALGAAPLPYGYYTFLRLIVCGVFGLAAYVTFAKGARLLPYAYGLLAVLFNPIVKIHLPKEVWAVVDILAAVFLLATVKRLKHAT
jgi:hypothetical protein